MPHRGGLALYIRLTEYFQSRDLNLCGLILLALLLVLAAFLQVLQGFYVFRLNYHFFLRLAISLPPFITLDYQENRVLSTTSIMAVIAAVWMKIRGYDIIISDN